MSKMWLEDEYPNQSICGIDEAGRGPLAGPCVVCGVVLPLNYKHPLINDSKQLSAKKRQSCLRDILQDAISIYIICVLPAEIDQKNIYRATQDAMFEIASKCKVDRVFTDAMPLKNLNKPYESFIKGDSCSISIAAASIVAKEMRDHIMNMYDQRYPLYHFAAHKGYPTQLHLQALNQYGITPIHRKSYGPVSQCMQMHLFD